MELTNANQREEEAKELPDSAIVINIDDEDNVHEVKAGYRDGKMLCSRRWKSTRDEFGYESNGCKVGGEVDLEVNMDGVRGGGEPLETEMDQEVDQIVDEHVWKENRGFWSWIYWR